MITKNVCLMSSFSQFFNLVAPTVDVLLSPKDTRIMEHDGVFLICEFRSSIKINVWWEKQGDILPEVLTRQIATTQWKYNSYFVVTFTLTIFL